MSKNDRAIYAAPELAVVLSHYDFGVIESVTEFRRGSRQSPKVGIVCEKGKFLLKRRATKRADPERVCFAHRVQSCLVECGLPIARLIPTKDGQQTYVSLRDEIYELFEFVPGQPYRRSIAETTDAGTVLARFHDLTAGFVPSPSGLEPRGDYHDAPGVRTGLCAIGSQLQSHDSFTGDEAELASLIQFLLEAYDRAAEAVTNLGFSRLPARVIHSDWHPGNLLFRKERVAAVIDFDSVRWSRRMVDIANGALQFSMLAAGDPATWPEHVDEARWNAFLSGYESACRLADREYRCLPHLMSEALIAECVPPITQTGSVGQWAGFGMLQMVRRKVDWIDGNCERLLRSVAR